MCVFGSKFRLEVLWLALLLSDHSAPGASCALCAALGPMPKAAAENLRCTGPCGLELPRGEFAPNQRPRKTRRCKACVLAGREQSRQASGATRRMASFACFGCERELSRDLFGPWQVAWGGSEKRCLECVGKRRHVAREGVPAEIQDAMAYVQFGWVLALSALFGRGRFA